MGNGKCNWPRALQLATQDPEPLLKIENITKSFSGVTVLDDVSFEVRPGEVHALIGENGAGKSTLMKIVTGAYQADCGEVFWKGRPVEIKTPRQAHDLGINIVHQELMLVPQLSIGENVFLGRHPVGRGVSRWVRWGDINEQASSLLKGLGHPLDPRRPVGELSIAEQQLVEIARALAFSVEGLTASGKFSDISFRVRQGEIVGLAGLVGAGRTELVETLFGAGEAESGKVYLEGQLVRIKTPMDAVRHRLALVADDRKA